MRGHLRAPGSTRTTTDFPPLRWGITLPFEVPKGTVVVEYEDGRWRVISYGRPAELFGRRDDALRRARAIAALYSPVWTIVEKPPQDAATRIA